ncbi:hypothetical protein G7067_10330 [Leucobacter insecticola]|uniref:histidine kinase n=1 Tax=Leucobacter insecticola TaxID=2714934 RepID=A0A6G8FKA2_9MICO|nr:histidine kinase [Leucobacter insecticola]QIM16709.1 hypothetical protein G7067_10330 [Leucobacter insecticola]
MSAPAVFEEPALRRPRIVRWFAERPRIADVLVILACAAPASAVLLLEPPTHAWLGWLCVGATALALWRRRQYPLVVLLVVMAFAALNPISAQTMSPGQLETFFTVYTLAAQRRMRTAILGALAGAVVVLAFSGLAVLFGIRDGFPASLLNFTAVIAIALGVAVRASRARREAITTMIEMREERARSAERTRIAAEMHDVVAHSITVMVALAGGAEAGWQKHPERARRALEQLGDVGARALEEMQRTLQVLHEGDEKLTEDLAHSGHNVPELAELVAEFREAGLPVTLAEDPELPSDPALRTTIYRVVRESLTNTLRHATGTSFVEVKVVRDADDVVATVTDNGRQDPARETAGSRLGLQAMRERAAAFGGTLEAGPLLATPASPGGGWRVCARLKVKEGP